MIVSCVPFVTLVREAVGSELSTRLPTQTCASVAETTAALGLICSTSRALIQLNDPGGGTMASQPVTSSPSTLTASALRSLPVG